jgi:hypothetical protein
MVFNPFSNNDDDDGGVLGDVDPDQNFLNEVRGNIIHGCNYYYSNKLHTELKDKLDDIDLSICHLNIRSLPKNIDTFNSTLYASGMNFNILAFTETWMNSSNVDAHCIAGFSHEYLIRDDNPEEVPPSSSIMTGPTRSEMTYHLIVMTWNSFG